MTTTIRASAIGLALLGLSTLAAPVAQAQSDYPFRLHNRSEGWTISSFQTFQGGSWSKNWLRERVRSGEFMDMDWNSNEGNCVVRFRVTWVDYGAEEFRTDFCTIRNLYMMNNGFRRD